MLFLDLHCLQSDGDPVSKLPATCAAINFVLRKVDDAQYDFSLDSSTPLLTSQLAHWLSQMGYENVGPGPTPEMVYAKELELLRSLAWQVGWPTTHVWASAAFLRFNVLTRSALATLVERVWQQGQLYSMMIVSRRSSMDPPPRQLANGLLCLGLAAAGLLPLEELCPTGTSPNDLEGLCARYYPRRASKSCVLPSEYTASMLSILEVATARDISVLRKDVGAVGPALREVLAEIGNGVVEPAVVRPPSDRHVYV
jgi:hypothetical protein